MTAACAACYKNDSNLRAMLTRIQSLPPDCPHSFRLRYADYGTLYSPELLLTPLMSRNGTLGFTRFGLADYHRGEVCVRCHDCRFGLPR